MIEISKIYYTLGKIKQNNSKIEKELGIKKNSINKLTGIKKRFISGNKETSENLALKVCKKINKSEVKKLSHIISVTNTPSIKFPGISNYISSSLKIKNVFCVNLNSGCTGYVDALILAYDIISNNNKSRILIVTSDTYSKFINKSDRAIRPLFSDGASATLIKYKKNGFKSLGRKNLNISKYSKRFDFRKR